MTNASLDTSLVDKAVRFAVDAHSGTERRGKGFPYVIHPLEAMEIVASVTSDPELLAAAVLHDTVEDTPVTLEMIREEFGPRVASIVDAESDRYVPGVNEQDSWRARKQAAIQRLSDASRDVKIVALGDKLSNMRAIERDYRQQGESLWNIFHAPGGKADHEWHYRSLATALSDLAGTDPYKEFVSRMENVFGSQVPVPVDMSEWELSGGGFQGKSYNHKDGKRMMKLYDSSVPLRDSIREFQKSRSIRAMGLNVPRALRLVTDGKNTGIEFERISPKRSFARAISEEPQNLEKYSREFARECRKLHSTPCNTFLFQSSKQRFKEAVNEFPSLTCEQKERLVAFINTIPDATTCAHGDLHIGNIITNGKENWLIDLGDFAYGDPQLDLGMFYMACNENPERLTRELYHISGEQIHEVWKYFTDEYFGPGSNMDEINLRLSKYALLYMIYFCRRTGIPPSIAEFVNKTLETL